MPERSLYEYAVIRIVPRVEREEFLNVGVVLLCRDRQFLRAHIQLDESRISAFAPDLSIAELTAYLCAFQQICAGESAGGPISKLPLVERFRWITAVRSTMLQTSSVHSGLCTDPESTIEALMHRLVLD